MSTLEIEKLAEAFALKQIESQIAKGEIKDPVKKSSRDLAAECVNGGRYVRAFNKIPGLDCYEKAVLKELASRFDFKDLDKNGFFKGEIKFLTQEQLAEDLSISEDKIQKVIKALSEKGMIEVISHPDFVNKRRGTNSYKISEKALLEAYTALQKIDEEKYAKDSEKLNAVKKSFIALFLSSPRLQVLHGGSEVSQSEEPATQIAASPVQIEAVEAPTNWIEASPQPDTVPLYSPLELSPSLSSVCEKENRAHTEKNNLLENDSPGIADKYAPKRSYALQNKVNGISTGMKWDLSDILIKLLGRKFVDNDVCGDIIEQVTSLTNIGVKDFRLMMNDLPNYDPKIIFNRELFSERSRFNLAIAVQNIATWVTSKEKIISAYEAVKKTEEEEERKKELIAKEYFQKQAEEKTEMELKRLEEKNGLKEKEIPFYLEKLPREFQDWYKSLKPLQKRAFDKDAMGMSEEQLIAYLDGILDRNKFKNKPVFDSKFQQQKGASM